MAARFGSDDPELARLTREKQDLARAWFALDRSLIAALATHGETRNNTLISNLRAQQKRFQDRLSEIDRRLSVSFPKYANLVDPKPLSVDEARRTLQPDEALLFYRVLDSETLVWVLTVDAFEWHRIAVPSISIDQKIASLRTGLDTRACLEAFPNNKKCASTATLPFNPAIAGELYKMILSPIEPLILNKRHLIVIPSGPLTSIPFHVLLTADSGATSFSDASWLVKRHAVSVLPAVSSLRALRSHARPSTAKRPYIGFANPEFCRRPINRSTTSPRALSASFRGRAADPEAMCKGLSPLPETAQEIQTVARALGATNPADVVIGASATEVQ